MPVVTKPFERYRIFYQSGPPPLAARIDCLTASGGVAGIITFVPEGAAVPPNTTSVGNVIFLRFPLSRYRDVVDILRNERPLALTLNTDTKVGWVATTTDEPAGEGEI
jgi:hypothetical protein